MEWLYSIVILNILSGLSFHLPLNLRTYDHYNARSHLLAWQIDHHDKTHLLFA